MEHEKMIYPCNWCGSCPIWLAAYAEGADLNTEEKIIAACNKRKCPLVGKEVIPEGVHEAYWLHRGQYNDYIWAECSHCGFREEAWKVVKSEISCNNYVEVKWNYCPKCGCKMRVK